MAKLKHLCPSCGKIEIPIEVKQCSDCWFKEKWQSKRKPIPLKE
jgi:ribosomal protein L37E